MLPAARHDLLVLCDSDMRVEPDYLRRIVAPFNTGKQKTENTEQCAQHPYTRYTSYPNYPLALAL